MSKIDDKVFYISIIADEMVKSLKAFNQENKAYNRNTGYNSIIASPHKARFNRLRIELDKKCVELNNIFKAGRYE